MRLGLKLDTYLKTEQKTEDQRCKNDSYWQKGNKLDPYAEGELRRQQQQHWLPDFVLKKNNFNPH